MDDDFGDFDPADADGVGEDDDVDNEQDYDVDYERLLAPVAKPQPPFREGSEEGDIAMVAAESFVSTQDSASDTVVDYAVDEDEFHKIRLLHCDFLIRKVPDPDDDVFDFREREAVLTGKENQRRNWKEDEEKKRKRLKDTSDAVEDKKKKRPRKDESNDKREKHCCERGNHGQTNAHKNITPAQSGEKHSGDGGEGKYEPLDGYWSETSTVLDCDRWMPQVSPRAMLEYKVNCPPEKKDEEKKRERLKDASDAVEDKRRGPGKMKAMIRERNAAVRGKSMGRPKITKILKEWGEA